jgi:hypothetical protein
MTPELVERITARAIADLDGIESPQEVARRFAGTSFDCAAVWLDPASGSIRHGPTLASNGPVAERHSGVPVFFARRYFNDLDDDDTWRVFADFIDRQLRDALDDADDLTGL